MNLAYLLEIACDIDPDRLIVTDDAESLTLVQLRDRARHAAGMLSKRADTPLTPR